MKAYVTVVASKNKNITDGFNINWKLFQNLIYFMSKIEKIVLSKEIQSRNKPYQLKDHEQNITSIFSLTPIFNRDLEREINSSPPFSSKLD